MQDAPPVHNALLDKLPLQFAQQEQFLKEIQNLKDMTDSQGSDKHQGDC